MDETPSEHEASSEQTPSEHVTPRESWMPRDDDPLARDERDDGLVVVQEEVAVSRREAHLIDRRAGWAAHNWGWLLALGAIAIVFGISAFFVPLVFGTDPLFMVIGIALWGVGQGAIGSILRAAVSQLVPQSRRGLGYGIYATIFGVLWFLGSAATGVLYVISVPLMIVASVAVQFVAVGIFVYIQRQLRKHPDLICNV